MDVPTLNAHSRPGLTRAQSLRSAIAVGVVMAGDATFERMTALASSAPSSAQDATILKFALLLEDLQAAFYAAALKHGSLDGELREFAEIVGSHEQQHAAFIRKVLGAKAGPKPRFEFGNAVRGAQRFIATAVSLEDLGVAAYNGQAPNLTPKALAAAARIVSVEGRHAAWIRDLSGLDPAPKATDLPLSAPAVAAALNKTGFVRSLGHR